MIKKIAHGHIDTGQQDHHYMALPNNPLGGVLGDLSSSHLLKSSRIGCELKLKFLKKGTGKYRTLGVPIGHVPGTLSKAMADKIDSEKGRKIYHQRIAIVEPVFANIGKQKGMNRFTLR